MNGLSEKLLGIVLAETLKVEALSPIRRLGDCSIEWSQRYRAIRTVAEFGVRINPRWLGSSSAELKAQQRLLRRLEVAELVELHAIQGRGVSHVRLTTEGRREAESYVKS